MRPFLFAAVVFAAGCAPTCAEVCNKLDRCGFDGTVQVIECRTACERQLAFAQELDDDNVAVKAFNDHRRCLGNTSCEDIEAGVCVEDDLFAIDGE
jgi:hypothetical protein